jgi:EpsI family protein
LISGIGFGAMFGLVFWLSDWNTRSESLWTDRQDAASSGVKMLRPKPSPAIFAIAMLSAFLAFDFFHLVTTVPLRGELRRLPSRIGRWEARGPVFQSSDLDVLPFDEKLFGNYMDADGSELRLFLGYFESQADGRELAGYAMRSVLSGHEHSRYALKANDVLRVNDFVTTTGPSQSCISYWYVVNGRVVAVDYLAKLYSAWDALVHGRNNGAVIVVRSRVRDGESIDDVRARLHDFLTGFVPVSKEYVPQL